jgi:hypothetical protein
MIRRASPASHVRSVVRALRAEGCTGTIVIETERGKVTVHPGSTLPADNDPANVDRTLNDRIRNRPWARSK